jgi:hypothetical protein
MSRVTKILFTILTFFFLETNQFPFGINLDYLKAIPQADRTLREQEQLPKEVMASQWDTHMKNFSSSDITMIDLIAR